MDKIMLETLGKMRDAFGVLYHASELIVAHAFGEYAADHAPPPPQTYHSGNGFQEIVSVPAIVGKTVAEIIEEVKKLIIELRPGTQGRTSQIYKPCVRVRLWAY